MNNRVHILVLMALLTLFSWMGCGSHASSTATVTAGETPFETIQRLAGQVPAAAAQSGVSSLGFQAAMPSSLSSLTGSGQTSSGGVQCPSLGEIALSLCKNVEGKSLLQVTECSTVSDPSGQSFDFKSQICFDHCEIAGRMMNGCADAGFQVGPVLLATKLCQMVPLHMATDTTSPMTVTIDGKDFEFSTSSVFDGAFNCVSGALEGNLVVSQTKLRKPGEFSQVCRTDSGSTPGGASALKVGIWNQGEVPQVCQSASDGNVAALSDAGDPSLACQWDSDDDGFLDDQDKCPNQAAGILDLNGDGCPDVVVSSQPECLIKPTCDTNADCTGFLTKCPEIGTALANEGDSKTGVGLGLHCFYAIHQCEIYQPSAPVDCPADIAAPPPGGPPPKACASRIGGSRECVNDDDCKNRAPSLHHCLNGCCGGDIDADHDSVPDSVDNCIGFTGGGAVNEDQKDCDGDGIGDACDTCAMIYDPTNADSDLDGVGDACAKPPVCGDGRCQVNENFISCPQDCTSSDHFQMCGAGYTVSDCRKLFVEMSQSPKYPFENPLTPNFVAHDSGINCCENWGCDPLYLSPDGIPLCPPGSYCDVSGYCQLLPCSADADCIGTAPCTGTDPTTPACEGDNHCDVLCGDGVNEDGECKRNCGQDRPGDVACNDGSYTCKDSVPTGDQAEACLLEGCECGGPIPSECSGDPDPCSTLACVNFHLPLGFSFLNKASGCCDSH